MLEEFMNVMTDNELDTVDEKLKNAEVKNLIDGLEMFSYDAKMLTNAYTDILCNDNVVYLLTRISQHPVFMKHFPELYVKNENGESVINCQQNSPYHRYGVFRHILYTIEYVGKDNLKYSKEELKLLKWAMLLHDIGKPLAKTTNLEGKDSFVGHDEISVEIAAEILNRFYFTEEEKKIILTLIKYHDRYLNEGELTYDNLSFLAQELENKKELFDMIIEVKTADNRAKSIAVYNKFLTVIPKYVEFENDYFSTLEPAQDNIIGEGAEVEFDLANNDEMIVGSEELITEIKVDQEESLEVKEKAKSKLKTVTLTKELFEEAYQNILHGKNLGYYFMPVVDVRNKVVWGYEIDATLDNEINLTEIFKMAKEEGKYEKINQLIALNIMEQGVKSKKNKNETLVVKIDMKSYEKYNNKSRIYDITDKDNVLILFENYDYSNVTDINEMCKEIKRTHGMVGLADFQDSTFTQKELANMNVDFIEYTYNKDEEKIKDLIEFCSSNTQKLWVSNIKTKKDFANLLKLNVQFMSGDCIFGKKERPEITEYEVEQLIV